MMFRRPNMLAVAALLVLTAQPAPNILDVWRERLAEWADAALRYVQQHGGTPEHEKPFRVVAFNMRRPGDWHELRLLEVASFLHREMMAFHAFEAARYIRGDAVVITVPGGSVEMAYHASEWRPWPAARGEHDEGDGVR